MSDTPAYRLIEISAAGTFGTVCVAQDLRRGHIVALKVLKEHHLNRPRVIARTNDEAKVMAQIGHDSIVKVEGMVSLEDRPILVMEWIRGLSLEGLMRSAHEGLPLGVALELIRQATSALGAAYNTVPPGAESPMRVIHRDIKPSNMLVSTEGQLKLVDFGIARAEFEGKEAQTMSMVLGARGYLAPERLDGHDDKPSCDIYSLGITLFELVTGRHIVLSVHKEFHAEALQKHLQAIHLSGLSDEGHRALRSILEGMCQYEESARPDHSTLVKQITDFQDTYSAHPDLAAWGQQTVYPLFKNREHLRPIDHPSYPELAFLERSGRKLKAPAAPDVDDTIRALLERPTWLEDREELDKLLVTHPHWSEAPFLEALPAAQKAWWRFWGGPERSREEIVAILGLLEGRPSAALRERCLQLQRHKDPAIAGAAAEVLGR